MFALTYKGERFCLFIKDANNHSKLTVDAGADAIGEEFGENVGVVTELEEADIL